MYPYTYPPNYMDVIGLKLYSNKHVNGFKYGLIREKYPLMEDIILVIGARGGIGRVRLRHRHEDFQINN